jgi:hypothetical protein
MMVRRVGSKHECIFAGHQRKGRRVGDERRLQVRDRQTLRGRSGYGQTLLCKQLDERGTLEPRKAPGKRPKLDVKHLLRKTGARGKKPLVEAMGRALGAVSIEDGEHSSLTVATASRRSNYERRC